MDKKVCPHRVGRTKRYLCAALAATMLMAACEKVPPAPDEGDTIVPEHPDTPADSSGTPQPAYRYALVLNEGPMGNNASLTHIDLVRGTLVADWFAAANGRGLGNVAQDLVLYGSKAYITVWGSGSLEVVDTATGHATHVDLGDRGPRYMAPLDGKLYITCYNPRSVIRVDTASLAVEATCLLGRYNPEGIAALDGRLWVASDNLADAAGQYSYDSTLYVIDPASFSLADSVVVGLNPQKVMAVDNTHLVVNCWGEWDMTTGGTRGEGSAVVDTRTLAVTPTGRLISNMTVHQGQVYAYASTYDAAWQMTTSFFRLDPQTLATTPFEPAGGVNGPYAIAVHPTSGNVYIATDGGYTSNGDLRCFTPDGTRLWTRTAGKLPSKVIFY